MNFNKQLNGKREWNNSQMIAFHHSAAENTVKTKKKNSNPTQSTHTLCVIYSYETKQIIIEIDLAIMQFKREL